MASHTIMVTADAYGRLRRLKRRGESFSDVILREIPCAKMTGAELLEHFEGVSLPTPAKEKKP